ncbi:hypothetical protein PAMP_008133 [Pampus punctatissimus]
MATCQAVVLDGAIRSFPASQWAFMLTGFQVPPPVTSTGNVFSLRLTSDFAVSAHGFKLNYEDASRGNCSSISFCPFPIGPE